MKYKHTIKKMIRPLPPQYLKWWANYKNALPKGNKGNHHRLQKRPRTFREMDVRHGWSTGPLFHYETGPAKPTLPQYLLPRMVYRSHPPAISSHRYPSAPRTSRTFRSGSLNLDAKIDLNAKIKPQKYLFWDFCFSPKSSNFKKKMWWE